MAFNEDVVKIINKNWSYSNTYDIGIEFSDSMKDAIEWIDETIGRDLNLHIVSANTPDFSNTPIEIYVGGQYRIHNGKDELYRFSVTFRDFDKMYLYRKFLAAYRLQKSWYFDDAKMKVTFTKDADYFGEIPSTLMEIDGCLIEGVSNIDINNNNEAQVAEFTVKFKATSPQTRS